MAKCLRLNKDNTPTDLREFYVSIRRMSTEKLVKLSAELSEGLLSAKEEVRKSQEKKRRLTRMVHAISRTIKESAGDFVGSSVRKVNGKHFYNLAAVLSLSVALPSGWRRCFLYNERGTRVDNFELDVVLPRSGKYRLSDLLDTTGACTRRNERHVFVFDIRSALTLVRAGGSPVRLLVRYATGRRREYVSTRLSSYWLGERS